MYKLFPFMNHNVLVLKAVCLTLKHYAYFKLGYSTEENEHKPFSVTKLLSE